MVQMFFRYEDGEQVLVTPAMLFGTPRPIALIELAILRCIKEEIEETKINLDITKMTINISEEMAKIRVHTVCPRCFDMVKHIAQKCYILKHIDFPPEFIQVEDESTNATE